MNPRIHIGSISLLLRGPAVAFLTLCWLGACEGTIDVPVDDGPSNEGGEPTSSSSQGGSGGAEICHGPTDFYCDEESDCECTVCAPAAGCNEGSGCLANYFCELEFEDMCSCADCDWDARCLSLTGVGCVNDAVCAPAEGCSCADCADTPSCSDNATYCVGPPDGICTAPDESCSCIDCLGAMECVCPEPMICEFIEPCICPDCWTDPYRMTSCNDDGVCDWDIYETCDCADCTAQPLCAGFPN